MATITKWKGIPHRYTLKEALNIGPLAIQKMDTQERAELAQFLHNQFQLRANTFVRANSIPFAFTKIGRDYYEEITVGDRKISVASRMNIGLDDNVVVTKGRNRMLNPALGSQPNPQNALISYIILHQDFFRAKSSTVTGWREIGRKEDERLFGTNSMTRRVQYIDENGKRRYRYETFDVPKYQMTEAERRSFWAVYEEVRKSSWTSINEYSSEEQQEFAAIWLKGNFNHLDIDAAFAKLSKELDMRPRFIKEKQAGLEPDADPFTSQRGHVYEGKGDIDDEFVW